MSNTRVPRPFQKTRELSAVQGCHTDKNKRKTKYMKTDIAQFVSGMDGQKIIPANVASFGDKLMDESKVAAGDAVDFAIYAAFAQAERQGEGLDEVLNHISYIHAQLGIFKRNLEMHAAETATA